MPYTMEAHQCTTTSHHSEDLDFTAVTATAVIIVIVVAVIVDCFFFHSFHSSFFIHSFIHLFFRRAFDNFRVCNVDCRH